MQWVGFVVLIKVKIVTIKEIFRKSKQIITIFVSLKNKEKKKNENEMKKIARVKGCLVLLPE